MYHYFVMSAKTVCDWLRLSLAYRMTNQLELNLGLLQTKGITTPRACETMATVEMDRCVGKSNYYKFECDTVNRCFVYHDTKIPFEHLNVAAIEQTVLSVLGKRGRFQSPLPPAKKTVVDIRQETNKMPTI